MNMRLTKRDDIPGRREQRPVTAYDSGILHREPVPSWREVLEHRRSPAGAGRVAAYAARYPGFAHVLEMLQSDDAPEGDEESPAPDCHTRSTR